MLTTESEYQAALASIQRLERESIPRERARYVAQGHAPETIEELMAQSYAILEARKHEVALYERIKAGDLSMFHHLSQLGHVLIAARIAKGWTRRELAQRLGVHETQVSRDERNEYHAIQADRLQRLCDVLGLELRIDAHLYQVAA